MATPGDATIQAIDAVLTAEQRAALGVLAEGAGLPATGWTAVPYLLSMAETVAGYRMAGELQRERPGRGWSWCLDAAEAGLRGDDAEDLIGLPKSVRVRLTAWRRNLRPELHQLV